MAFEIVRTKKADKELEQLVSYLEEEWGDKVTADFINRLVNFLEILSRYPEIGSIANKESTIRGFPLSKHTRIFYRIKDKRIILLNLFDSRQKPKEIV